MVKNGLKMVGPLFSLPQAICEQTVGCIKAPKIQTICAFWFIWNMWLIGQVLCLLFCKKTLSDARPTPRSCLKRAAFNNLYKDFI